MSGRLLDLARMAREEATHPCCDCGEAANEETLFCPPCWGKRRGPRRLLAFDEERLRHLEERRERALAALAERYCGTCGFSLWRVSSRCDASCYACDLMRAGKPLRCARCGRDEWRRDEHGHRFCATCSPGDKLRASLEI